MVISVNQPYFAPYAGFFQKAMLSDKLVLLDDVQFPLRTTWITRNRLKNDQGVLWMTVPVWKKGLGLQRIMDVEICHEERWHKKFLKRLRTAYAKAPYLPDHYHFFERIFSTRYHRIIDLNLEILFYLKACLHIETEMVLQSDLGITGKGGHLLIEICRKMNASRFMVQKYAAKYLDADVFKRSGISLAPFVPRTPVYPQLWGDFIPNLSMFDMLLNCGPKAREILS